MAGPSKQWLEGRKDANLGSRAESNELRGGSGGGVSDWFGGSAPVWLLAIQP
jgi:hypothetical protein